MNYTLVLFLVCGALAVGILAALEVGRRIGARRLAQDPAGARAGIGAVDGAVFGLLGLLIAFTFSGAAARFEARRGLVTEEANAVGTAWLRIDALPVEDQPALRDLFRRYLDSRIATYRKVPDMAAAMEEYGRSVAMQGEIWRAAVAGAQASSTTAATMLLLPALNQMIDITTTRLVATQSHPPYVIFGMLMLLALAGGLLAGYGMAEGRGRNWLHMAAFALTMSIAVYVILDLEYPRLGLIRVDSADQVMLDLRRSMD